MGDGLGENDIQIAPVPTSSEENWMSQWYDENIDAFAATHLEDPVMCYQMSLNPSAPVHSLYHAATQPCEPSIVIDSGASKTVVGIAWICKWSGWSREEILEHSDVSRRVFKF